MNCFQVFMIFGLWHQPANNPRYKGVVNCFQVFMIFGLWHHQYLCGNELTRCELLSSFYDLWSLTSINSCGRIDAMLWIAFKFLWSLVFDILLYKGLIGNTVVNCFQVFMIFGLWHLIPRCKGCDSGCELLSSFYDLWSLTSVEVVCLNLS